MLSLYIVGILIITRVLNLGNSFGIFFLGVGLFLLSIIIIKLITENVKSKSLSKKHQKEFEDFKARAVKIKIDLQNITIKSNQWTEEVVINNSKYAGLNQLSGHPERNLKSVTHSLNNLIFEVVYKGQKIRINEEVRMEPKSLEMLLAVKEETLLYIDPNDLSYYYLDLEFLY